MIKDVYELVKDLIAEAKKQQNLEMVEKLIDIKIEVTELQDENRKLNEKIKLDDRIIRHEDGEYVTLKDDHVDIYYCSTCWGLDSKLIQINKETMRCPICYNKLISAAKGR